VLFQLLPLFIGIILFTSWIKGAQILARIFNILTNFFMVIVIGLTIALYWSLLVNVFGQFLILSILITIGFSILLSFALGGPGRDSREVLTYGTTQRNAGAAMMIAMTSFALIPTILVSVVVYSLIQLIFVVFLAFIFKRQKESSKDAPAEE
jgi:BASS family bile acid:Na+ symporter